MTSAEFQSSVLQHATMPAQHDDDLVSGYLAARRKAIMTAEEIGVGEAGIQQAICKVATAFARRWILREFAILDRSFASASQPVHVVFDKGTIPGAVQAGLPPSDYDPAFVSHGTIPVYWCISLDTKPFITSRVATLGDKTLRLSSLTAIRGKRGERQISVSATPPNGMTNYHRCRAAAALAHIYRGQAECIAHGVDLFDDLAVNRERRRYHDHPDFRTVIHVLWAPLLSDLSVIAEPVPPAGDPAIVLEFAGLSVLLDFYDAPNEGPIEAIVREFSEGSL